MYRHPPARSWQIVHALAPRQRMAIVLRYVADLTQNEIPTAMEIKRSTVSNLLADAHTRLAGLINDAPDDQERLDA